MAREIEVKVKLKDEDSRLLENWLDRNAKYLSEETHLEYYLNNPKQTFYYTHKEGFKDSENYLRIRINKKGDSICLKKFKIDQDKGTAENIDEMELNISNGKEMLNLMQSIGYTDILTIDKNRRIYEFNEFEIAVDEVTNLGKFAEVELKEQIKGDIKEGWQKIRNFLKQIGFKEIEEQHRGYVSMLWNPDKDFGVKRTL